MTSTTSHRLAVGALSLSLAVGASLGFAACGGDDVSKDKFKSELVDQGTEEGVADCLVNDLFENLDQDDINKVYAADTEEEAGETGSKALTDASTRCATEAEGAPTEGVGGDDPTETTEAEG